jgi:integrating conjugative element membrane protein (TIGR03747 family)
MTNSSTSCIELILLSTIGLICWFVVAFLGCIAMSTGIVALHGRNGFLMLSQLLQSDCHYITSSVLSEHALWINHWIQAIPDSVTQPNFQLPIVSNTYQHELWLQLSPYINAMFMGVKLLVIRLYLLLRWCPLFLILGIAGLIDGLAGRYIRRMSAGRESALIYHNAKPLIMLSLMLGIFIDLILPISVVHTEWIWVCAAIIFGLAIQITAKSFKKYL